MVERRIKKGGWDKGHRGKETRETIEKERESKSYKYSNDVKLRTAMNFFSVFLYVFVWQKKIKKLLKTKKREKGISVLS